MAERMEEFETTPVYGPGKAGPGAWRYPWHEWQDGGVWKLRPGEDWPSEIDAGQFRDRVHIRAKRIGRYARTHKGFDERGEYLVIQFLDPVESAL